MSSRCTSRLAVGVLEAHEQAVGVSMVALEGCELGGGIVLEGRELGGGIVLEGREPSGAIVLEGRELAGAVLRARAPHRALAC